MQSKIVYGSIERYLQLAKTISLLSLLLSLYACAVKAPEQWDPMQTTPETQARGIDRSTYGMSAAMSALIQQADQSIELQRWSAAMSTLERALRINPKQAEAWTRMAVVYLGQNNPEQCIHMAKKSNVYARANNSLMAYNWLLMSRAYEQMGQMEKAEQALMKSNQLQGAH